MLTGRSRGIRRSNKWFGIVLLVFTQILFWLYGNPTLSAMAVHSIVYSPDNSAWTVKEELPYTDHYNNFAIQGISPPYWYQEGMSVQVGMAPSELKAGLGEHIYSYRRMGEIPLWKWEVGWSKGRCIHTGNAIYWHGMRSASEPCQNAYFSGWKGYCSDCGGQVTSVLIYMSKEAAANLMKINTGQGYFYHCPTCGHLENQCDKVVHICQAVSANQYKIVYERNATMVRGFMDDSLHMVNNTSVYEGEEIVPVKRLRKNVFERDGYCFAGWNDQPDGKGNAYTDGQEILNLCLYDHHKDGKAGEVHLYAQWTPSASGLLIDPNGGTVSMEFWSEHTKAGTNELFMYDRKNPIEISKEKGAKLQIPASCVIAPCGKKVSFQLNGGSSENGQGILPISGTTHFLAWQLSEDFRGKITDQTYLFRGPDGHKDVIKALYEPDAIVLPSAKKKDANFGGWYSDEACTKYVGTAGDRYIPREDTILYAKWTDLVLRSKENLTACNRRGAVDLNWQQIDTADKLYRIYISEEGEDFRLFQKASDSTEKVEDEKTFSYCGEKKTYIVSREGFYKIQAYGAAGAAWGEHVGGKGGYAEGKFCLQKGDVLTITVGGQNGYNGGGTSTEGGNGGGASGVSLNGAYLVIAAGGGGATEYDNGKAGGESGVKKGFFYGESGGTAGGGAGYKGGLSGSVIRHIHTSDCLHQHTADCYETGICGGTYQVEKVHMRDCPCDIQENSDGTYSYMGYALRCYGTIPGTHCEAHCELNSAVRGHCVYDYHYTCEQCGDVLIYKNMPPDIAPVSCEKMTGTKLVCGYTQQLMCGYEQGAVLSHSPAEGGDNYVSVTALDQTKAIGIRDGNGMVIIKADSVGYTGEMELKGVAAYDKVAPERINQDSVKIIAKNSDVVMVTFKQPEDHGTNYRFRVESVTMDGKNVCRSNITSHCITTGVAGYYYRLDERPTLSVDAKSADNPVLLSGEKIQIKPPKKEGYLHIAPVDTAGNVGETIHVHLSRQKMAWDLSTDQMKITDVIKGKSWGSVYESGGLYYVRADGNTPFVLEYDSYLNGEARNDYQIDRQIICISNAEGMKCCEWITSLPHTIPFDLWKDSLDPGTFECKNEGEILLSEYPYEKAERCEQSRVNHFQKAFTVRTALNGSVMVVTPKAGACVGEEVKYSSEKDDQQHGLTIIPDGEAPVINGVEWLENVKSFSKEEDICIKLFASDALSGVDSFLAIISNTQLHYERTLTADPDGNLEINLPVGDTIRQGDFSIRLEATDHVGNRCEWTYGMSDFVLEASITRVLSPHDPRFKGGESGILSIQVDGFAERVEIIFPEYMKTSEWDNKIMITYGDDMQYTHVDTISFMIPLYMAPGEAYPVIVRAYKKEQIAESIPTFCVSEEASVLGEIRTRLR